MQLIREIQEKFQLGSQAAFTLKTGERVSGLLVGIGLDSITLNLTNGVETILVNNILEVDTLVQDGAAASDLPDLDQFEKQAFEKLTKIEGEFQTNIRTAKVEKLKQPDQRFPASELSGWAKTGIAGTWNTIWTKFAEIETLDNLDAKDNIDWIITSLKSLVSQFPDSPSLKRLLAYFYTKSENWDEALSNYQKAAVQSKMAEHWLDVAVSALKVDKEELACCSLGEFFYESTILKEEEVWYVYVGLLERFNDLRSFREQCRVESSDENEPEFLLKTAVYLLKKIGKETSATEILKKQLAGEFISFLLEEGCQELYGDPTESYQQVFTEFMNTVKGYTEAKYANELMDARTASKQTFKGDNLYTKAKRANDSGDLKTAKHLYRECIKQNTPLRESAIKDLASLFDRLGQTDDGIKLLEENFQTAINKNAVNHLLVNLYPKARKYKKAINLLLKLLRLEEHKEKQSDIRWQIANNHIKLGNYEKAQDQLYIVQELRPDNIAVKQYVAFCLAKQGRYDQAKQTLKHIQDSSSGSEARTLLLLKSIEKAEVVGEELNIDHDDVIQASSYSSELTYSSLTYSSELTEFPQFFLERCHNLGIRPDRLDESGKYKPFSTKAKDDMKELEKRALNARATPSERSDYFLSAAKICNTEFLGRDHFYSHLCRSFTSKGDATVAMYEDLDIAREWYREALIAYDKGGRPMRAGTDAAWSLVRYLYAILCPHDKIRQTFGLARYETSTIGRELREAIPSDQTRETQINAMEAIADLILHSQYAKSKILKPLFADSRLKSIAIEYLKKQGITIPANIKRISRANFIGFWNELKIKHQQMNANIANRLRGLHNAIISQPSLEGNIIRIRDICQSNLLDQRDNERLMILQQIFETTLALCDSTKAFEQRENLHDDCRNFSENLLSEIEKSPTKLSVEEVYPIISNIREKTEQYFENVSKDLKPRLIPKLATESAGVPINGQLHVQISVANEQGRMSPDELKLVIQEDKDFFQVTNPEIQLNESLHGGEETTLIVPLHLTKHPLDNTGFPLSVHLEYKIPGDPHPIENPPVSLQIRFGSEFKRIDNPYNITGKVAADMFIGRDQLIGRIARSFKKSQQNISVLMYGQFRCGKTNVLLYLKDELEKDPNLHIIHLEGLGNLMDPITKTSALYRFFQQILMRLKDSIETRVKEDEDLTPLKLDFPVDDKFYNHPAPLEYFAEILRNFKDQVSQHWGVTTVVLMIDEFQYIYELIVDKKIDGKAFMMNWKSLLQQDLFSPILVGPDVIPKFINDLDVANMWGTTEDVHIGYLTPQDAQKLIERPIRIGGKNGDSRYRGRAVERVLGLAAGNPFYIQYICHRIVEYMNRKQANLVTEVDVDQVLQEMISGHNAIGIGRFQNLINSGDRSTDAISEDDALKVLTVIAKNSSGTNQCNRDLINCDAEEDVDVILEDLVTRKVVERNNQSYKIQVGLFKEWLIVNG